MAVWVALLRAVNVGGTGKIAMGDLQALCRSLGLEDVETYIQSGNVVFTTSQREKALRRSLEEALAAEVGREVGVVLRLGRELADIAERNPFSDAAPNRVIIQFYDHVLPRDAFDALIPPGSEEVRLDGREVFVHYPDGQGRSKLKLPFASQATGRNLNTVRRLVAMCEARRRR